MLRKSKHQNTTIQYYKEQHVAWNRTALHIHSKGEAVRISADTLTILNEDFSGFL